MSSYSISWSHHEAHVPIIQKLVSRYLLWQPVRSRVAWLDNPSQSFFGITSYSYWFGISGVEYTRSIAIFGQPSFAGVATSWAVKSTIQYIAPTVVQNSWDPLALSLHADSFPLHCPLPTMHIPSGRHFVVSRLSEYRLWRPLALEGFGVSPIAGGTLHGYHRHAAYPWLSARFCLVGSLIGAICSDRLFAIARRHSRRTPTARFRHLPRLHAVDRPDGYDTVLDRVVCHASTQTSQLDPIFPAGPPSRLDVARSRTFSIQCLGSGRMDDQSVLYTAGNGERQKGKHE